jgi:alpha(1,3/1,4) fucosyltransferase
VTKQIPSGEWSQERRVVPKHPASGEASPFDGGTRLPYPEAPMNEQATSPRINIDLTDFGGAQPKNEHFFFKLLRKRFPVEVTDDPDFLIYSHNSNLHRLYTCKKIFWTSEVYAPNWRECDYAMTHHILDDPRHLRLPLYATWVADSQLVKQVGEAESWYPVKTKFCCFFSSYLNRKTEHRGRFFHLLSRYKRVDAGGKALNNIGYELPFDPQAKMEFLKPYKFYMAFENESVPGYTTEKIAEAMVARCVPIYWGNPRVVEEFNPKSFINANDFPGLDALAEHVAEVDRNEALYQKYLREPFFHGNQPNEYFDHDRIRDFFGRIFADPTPPLAARQKRLFGRWMLLKRNPPHRMRILTGGGAGAAPMTGDKVDFY